MIRFYVNANTGEDSLADGSKIHPYKTLQACIVAKTFLEDTEIILNTGSYILTETILSKLADNKKVVFSGMGKTTFLSIGNSSYSWGLTDSYGHVSLVGKATTELVFRKLIFTNKDMSSSYTSTSSNGDRNFYFIYMASKMTFINVVFYLPQISYYNSFPYARIYYFFRGSGTYTFQNCTVPLNCHPYMIEPLTNVYLTDSYGAFTGTNTNWGKVNSCITSTPSLDTNYNITDSVYDTLLMGVYHNVYSWYPIKYIIMMGEKYYSIKDEFYDVSSHMYKPITLEEIQTNGFERYSIGDLFYFTDTNNIGGNIETVSPKNMTTNTAPTPYVVTTSSAYNTTYLGWKAFNGTNIDSSDCWITTNGTNTGWIMIDLGSEKKINGFSISNRNYSDGVTSAPKDFYLEGSNDGLTFTKIKSFVGESGWTVNQKRDYLLNEDASWRYFKITITANNGLTAYTAIGEIRLNYTTPILDTFKPIDKFDNFKFISDTNSAVQINGLKTNKELAIASGNIVISMANDIKYYKLTTDITNNSNIKIVLSTDNGLTWLTSKDGVNLINTDCIIPIKDYALMTDQEKTEFKIAKDIISDVGMTVNMFNSFNFNVIHDYGVRFAYVITRPKYGDVANVKQLEWKYDAKGYLKELKDTEYDLELYNHRLQLKPTADLGIVKVSIIT